MDGSTVPTTAQAEPPLITRWVRWAALSALVGAGMGFVGDLYHIYWGFFTDLERSELLDSHLYVAHGILIAFGYALVPLVLVALLLRMRARFPVVGAVGILFAFVGTTLVAADYWAESALTPGIVASQPALADVDPTGFHLMLIIIAFAFMSLGWILVAVGAWRGGAPRALCILLILGALAAFTPFSGSNLLLFVMIGALAVWLHRRPVRTTSRSGAVPARGMGAAR